MQNNLRKGIVRILKPSGQTAGTGFVISPQLIITCAHVIELPGCKLPAVVHFVLLENGKELIASVEEQYWRDSKHEDIAILRVNESFTDDIPLKLGTSANIAGHAFHTYGFPEGFPQGILVKGLIDGENGDSSLLQLTSQEITEGVSGAPVLDQQTRRVVGMITARARLDLREVERKISGKKETVTVTTGRLEETAFASPTRILLEICPDLKTEDICPYLGLRAFTQDDADFFCGRERLVDKFIESLQRNPRFLAVVGSSGSGKSSVVQAGLLPRIQQENVIDFQNCHIVKLRPGTTPMKAFSIALSEVFGIHSSEIESSDSWGAVQQCLQSQQNRTLIVIDQFEELFTLCSTEAQRYFTRGLLRLLQSPLTITLIVTIRADFYDLLLKADFGEWLEIGQINVSSMLDRELIATVTQPAARVGLELESGLLELILTDLRKTTKNPLPLLEFCLTQLWKVEHIHNLLTCESYVKMGRVTGAIAQWADAAYHSLSSSEQKTTRQIFTRLLHYTSTEILGTSRRRHLSELAVSPQEQEFIHILVNKLADNRLVVTDTDPITGEMTIEIIHETLIQEWQQLYQWITENRENLIQRDKIETSANEWLTHKKSRDYLLRGKQLSTARIFQRNSNEVLFLSGTARDYIQLSLKQQRIARLQAIGVIITPLIFLGIPLEMYVRNQEIKSAQDAIASGVGVKEHIEFLTKGCFERTRKQEVPEYLMSRLFGNCISLNQLKANDANLQSINLRNVNFRSAGLERVIFKNATLQNVALSDAKLRFSDFNGANLQDVDLQGAILENADFESATLKNVKLQGAVLRGAKLRSIELSNIELSGMDFSNADLFLANLNHTILERSNFENASLRHANLTESSLIRTNFKNTDLSWASLDGANLDGANLSNANFRNANLEKADLSGANLRGANLDGAIVTNAQLAKAVMCNTTLPNGSKSNSGCNTLGKVIGEVDCYSTDRSKRHDSILFAALESMEGGFNFLMIDNRGRYSLLLDRNLRVQEAYSIEGNTRVPWNLVAYQGEQLQIASDGTFKLRMMVSTRSSCEFRGKTQFRGGAKAQLFGN